MHRIISLIFASTVASTVAFTVASTVAATLLLGACTLTRKEATQCSSHSECRDFFGDDWTCTPDGFCAGPIEVALQNECGNAQLVDIAPARERIFHVTLSANASSDNCLDMAGLYQGVAGFFRIPGYLDEKLHIHATMPPQSAVNALANIVILTGDAEKCVSDEGRDCRVQNRANFCGIGRDEHLSLLPSKDGDILIGFDTVEPLTEDLNLSLTMVRPECQNDFVEHDETCERDPTSSDQESRNCNTSCNQIIAEDCQTAGEANDDPVSSILLVVDTDNDALRGIRGDMYPCDYDLYSIDLLAGEDLRVSFKLQGNGASEVRECLATQPAVCTGVAAAFDLSKVHIELFPRDAEGSGPLISSTVDASSGCPVLDTTALADAQLPAGKYIVRIWREETGSENPQMLQSLWYALDFQVIKP